MSKKNLVQELREIAENKDATNCETWEHFGGWSKLDCKGISCIECRKIALNTIADRIEAEYEPKPEPDTVEKVAKDMVAWMDGIIGATKHTAVWLTDEAADPFRKRLEALGVTFDD